MSKLTLDDLERFLSVQAPSASLEKHAHAAAVLSTFDPFKLNPVGGGASPHPRDEVLSYLLPMCEPVNQDPELGLWTLSLSHRRAALKTLATREEMRKALGANPERQNTVFQKMFERLIEGPVLELDQLSREELAALLEVLEWVEDILDGLPQRTAIRTALSRSDLLSPMERLSSRGFFGREEELAQLSEYVFGPKSQAPLFVFGTGGVGKSTLLARFVLTHAVPQKAVISYVDVDRATIRPDQPLTVLLDFVTQLHSQLMVSPEIADSIVKEITFALSRHESGRDFESANEYGWLVGLVAAHLNRLLNGQMVLLIVDTLEEAQFLGPDVMEPFIKFLLWLDDSLKELRVILSGRTLPDEYVHRAFNNLVSTDGVFEDPSFLAQIPRPTRPLNLTELAHEPARQLLRSALAETTSAGIMDNDLDDVIGLVGRNPMCLQLAARLLEEEGVEKLRAERSEIFAKLRAEKIQALLYGRILRHVHDDQVRKVAYPGLIVRRIDPDVIREVLAEPCKLKLRPDHNEHHIFADLAKEKALMFTDPVDGSLRHRADVRRSMLEDLTDHIPQEVIEDIDSRAVAFYSKQTGEVARAEEIYHRLRLREDESVLNSRWMPEAGAYLQRALNEVAPQERLWLAERLKVTLDDSVRQAASQDAWEKQAARSADRYLKSRSPEKALQVLHERKTRLPRSPLYTLETESYRFLEMPDEALAIAREGVESASKAGAIDMALDLLLKMVVIEEGRENLQAAEQLLKEAIGVSANSSDQLLRLRVQITRIRLQRQLRPEATEERVSLKDEALRMLTDDLLKELRDYPVLLREVAAELSKQDPRIAAAAFETLGIEVLTDAQAEAFGRAITNITDKADVIGKRFSGKDVTNLDELRKWATEELTRGDTRKLRSTLASAEVDSTLLTHFRDYFRAGVSSALKGKSFDKDSGLI